MEFRGFKIDFNALAALVSAVTAAVLAWRGFKQRKDKKDGVK